MRSRETSLLALLFFASWSTITYSQQTSQPSSSSEVSSKQLSEIEDFVKQSVSEHQQNLQRQNEFTLKGLSLLLQDPAALLSAYKEAYVTLNFKGLPDEAQKIAEWENKNKPVWKSDTFMWCLRMHIKYLIATLVKTSGKEEEAVSLTVNWIDEFAKSFSSLPEILKHDILTVPLSQSVFVKANHMAKFLNSGSGWYTGDLTRVGEMHRNNIISYYRAKKDPQIFDLWQADLKLEQSYSTYQPLLFQRNSFKTELYPWLLWQMGKDYYSFGLSKKAIETFQAAIKQNPDSECYEGICNDLKKCIIDVRSK